MSLVRIATRIACVEALKGRTLVGDNVLNSQIGALSVATDGSLNTDQEKPFITVYTESSRGAGEGTRSLSANGETEFVIESGILMSHLTRDKETDEAVVLEGIPATDDAFEFHLDIVMRQIVDALTDPASEWAEIFRSLSTTWKVSERARTSGDTRGPRLAAHQVKITANLIVDPVRGSPLKPEQPLAKFFAKALASDDRKLTAQVEVMQAQIEGNETGLQTAIRRYGMTLAEAAALQLQGQSAAEISGLVINTEINDAGA